jgi:hypothetical protein
MLGNKPAQVRTTATGAFCSSSLELGSVYAFLSAHRRELSLGERVRHPYPSATGKPPIPAPRVLTIVVLQVLKGLADTETMEPLRSNLRGKLGLDL